MRRRPAGARRDGERRRAVQQFGGDVLRRPPLQARTLNARAGPCGVQTVVAMVSVTVAGRARGGEKRSGSGSRAAVAAATTSDIRATRCALGFEGARALADMARRVRAAGSASAGRIAPAEADRPRVPHPPRRAGGMRRQSRRGRASECTARLWMKAGHQPERYQTDADAILGLARDDVLARRIP